MKEKTSKSERVKKRKMSKISENEENDEQIESEHGFLLLKKITHWPSDAFIFHIECTQTL